MKKTFKKYSKHLLSFALLAVVFGLPMMACAGTNYLDEFRGAAGYDGSSDSLVEIIGKAIGVILAFLGIILILYIIFAGWMWMSAGGDEAKVKKAKTMLQQAVIGMIIIFAAYAITTFVIENLTTVTGVDLQS